MVNKRFTTRVLLGFFLLGLALSPARAHSPHDHIEAFDLGPSGENPDVEVMLIVVRGNLWRSIDHGDTWKRIVRGIDARWELNSLVMAPAPDGPVWYLGTDGDGVYRSTDDGWSWSKMNEGLAQTKVKAMAASEHHVILATTDARLYLAKPEETQWTEIRGHLEKITAVYTAAGAVIIGDEKGQVHQSDDEGKTWREGVFGKPDPAGVTALHESDEAGMMMGFGTAGIFIEPGAEPANTGLTDQRITHFASTPDGPLYAVTWNDGVFVSRDSGLNWEPRSRGLTTDKQGDRRGLPQFTVLRVADDGSLFLAGYDGLFHSADEGLTWRQILTLPQTLLIDFDLSPDYRNDRELSAITYWKGAARSRDGGETWEAINGGLAPSFWTQAKRLRKEDDEYAQIQRFHSITYSPDYALDHTLFAGLRNWFLISADGGDSWEKIELTQFADGEDVIPDRLRFSSDFATDDTLLFCCRYGEGKTRAGAVFRSSDRGRTWQETLRLEGKYMQSLALSPDFAEDGTGFVSSAQGGGKSQVFRTTDGGLTWREVTGDLVFSDFGAELALSPSFATDKTAWAGTEQGLWRSTNAGDTWSRIHVEAFSEDGFIDMIALSPASLPDRRMIITVKGEGMFESTDGGENFAPFHKELFLANHQFNRLWSYSPGALLKFAPTGDGKADLFGMTGEEFIRLPADGGEPTALPMRQAVDLVGTIDINHWRGAVISLCVAGAGALGVILSAILRWRRIRAQRPRGV